MAKHSSSREAEFQTISYKLGKAILEAKNLNGLISLPAKLLHLRKEVLSRKHESELHQYFQILVKNSNKDEILHQIYLQHSIKGILDFLNWHTISDIDKAELLLLNAKKVELLDPNLKQLLVQIALKFDKSEKVLRANAWIAYRANDKQKLKEIVELLKEKGKLLADKQFLITAEKFAVYLKKLHEQPAQKIQAAKPEITLNIDKKDAIPSYKSELFEERVITYYYLHNSEELIEKIKQDCNNLKATDLAFTLIKAGKVVAEKDKTEEVKFCEEAVKLDQSQKILRAALWAYQRGFEFEKAQALILKLDNMLKNSDKPEDKDLLDKIYRMHVAGLLIEKFVVQKPIKQIDLVDKRIAYVLHNSFPYSTGGYATRAFGVADGLRQHGYEVIMVNRPGFPLDIKPDLVERDVPLKETISGFEYVRTLSPLRKGTAPYEYMLKSADALQKRFEEYRPSYVVAASNHLTAIPALIAAKRLGIPFIYEVRGFWEITRVSREPEYEYEPAYKIQVLLETIAAKHADHVFTLTNPMLEELVDRGIPKEKLDLMPNSCNPADFTPISRNKSLARKLHIPTDVPVIGYIGTFVQYEGLDDLAEACGELKKKGLKFRLLLVGNENTSSEERGPITQKIIDIAKEYNYTEWLIMPGRVPHEEVEAYYSLIDVAPFPRKPQPVCEMVSPMKPLEASAMKKAIVVSSVRALTEMIVDGHTGLVFEKGNTKDLSEKLEILIADKKLRKMLGENGRVWVESERTWMLTTKKLVNNLISLGDNK